MSGYLYHNHPVAQSIGFMRKIKLIAHISLDGFIANATGSLEGFQAGEENLDFVCDIVSDCDTAIMGKNTFLLLDPFWLKAKDQLNASAATVRFSKWYCQAKRVAVSKASRKSIHGEEWVSTNLVYHFAAAKKQAGKDMVLFASPGIFHELQSAGLIDEYWIFTNPVLFGTGIPLFDKGIKPGALTLKKVQQFPNGELAQCYGGN